MNPKWTNQLVAALILSASCDFAVCAADPKPAGESQCITHTRQIIFAAKRDGSKFRPLTKSPSYDADGSYSLAGQRVTLEATLEARK